MQGDVHVYLCPQRHFHSYRYTDSCAHSHIPVLFPHNLGFPLLEPITHLLRNAHSQHNFHNFHLRRPKGGGLEHISQGLAAIHSALSPPGPPCPKSQPLFPSASPAASVLHSHPPYGRPALHWGHKSSGEGLSLAKHCSQPGLNNLLPSTTAAST